MKLLDKCSPIRVLLSDVDGVMTDGGLHFDNQGVESKVFHVRDGSAIKLWHRAGFTSGLITGRNSHVVQVRASELGIGLVRQGVQDKLATLEQILEQQTVRREEVCYIGDDLQDLPVLRNVGLAVAVADAADELRQMADYTTSVPGGRGAIRETVEMILKNQDRWEDLIRKYTTG